MRDFIVKIGRLTTVLFLTLISIIASILITFLFLLINDLPQTSQYYLIAVIAPTIIAPTVTWYIVGIIIEVHQLELEMRFLATYDPLSETLNRSAFNNQCSILLRLTERNLMPISLLFLDIDNFKAINDNYGHSVGDQVIKSLGQTLNQCKRNSDLVGRFGGEEFIILLTNTDLSGAYQFAEKIQLQIQGAPEKIDDKGVSYTVSIGISVRDNNNPFSLEQLYQQADKALYRAKQNGKNRIEVANSSLTQPKKASNTLPSLLFFI